MHDIIEAFCALEDICKAQKRANIPHKSECFLFLTARRFAATFLMPAKAVGDTVEQLGIQRKHWSYELLFRIKHRFGVSAEAFLYRLNELDLIDPSLVQPLKDKIHEHYGKRDFGEPDLSRRLLTSRNLKYMRKFAESWKNRQLVQCTVALIPWRSNLALLDKLKDHEQRLWYAQKTTENGWSRDVLSFQIETQLHKRLGKATNNIELALPPADSDMASQIFKRPLYL